MPLVRIDLTVGTTPAFRQQLGNEIYEAMRASIAIPENDRFQIITEHEAGTLIADPTYLGIARSAHVVIIQITLNEGRTLEQKKALFLAIAQRLHAATGLRTEDVLISLVEVKRENWSFGNGIAQYAPA